MRSQCGKLFDAGEKRKRNKDSLRRDKENLWLCLHSSPRDCYSFDHLSSLLNKTSSSPPLPQFIVPILCHVLSSSVSFSFSKMILCKTSLSLHENIREIAPSSEERRVSGRKDRNFERKSRKRRGKEEDSIRKGEEKSKSQFFDRHGRVWNLASYLARFQIRTFFYSVIFNLSVEINCTMIYCLKQFPSANYERVFVHSFFHSHCSLDFWYCVDFRYIR